MVSFSFHYSSFFRSAFSLMWLPGLVGRSETRLNLQLGVTYWMISGWCGLRVFDGRVNMDSDVWENNPKMFPMCQWLSSPVRLKWVRHDDNDVCKVNSLTKVTLSGVIIHRSPAFPFPLEVGVESVVPMDTRVEKSRSVKLLFRETYSVGSTGSHVILLPKLNTQLIHQNRS